MEQIEVWEMELDCMGPFAPPADLLAHYKKAPQGAPSLALLGRMLRASGALQ